MTKRLPQRRLYARRSGYSTLIAVLVTTSMGLVIVTSAAILGVGGLQTSNTMDISAMTRSYADACADEGIFRLKDDLTYSGGSLVFNDGSCTISITGSGNSSREVRATAQVDGVVRRVQVTIGTVQPRPVITGWAEVDTF